MHEQGKMKKLKIIRNIALSMLFLLLLHLSVRYLGYVMFPDGGDGGHDAAVYHFSFARKNSADTVFVGSSHQFCSVDVNLLNEEYGHNSILLTSSSQGLRLSYFAVMYAIERQHPDTIVLEASMACNDNDDLAVIEKHYLLDDMPNWSRTKWACIKDTGDEAYLYLYPLTAMHSYWADVKAEDFRLPERLEEDRRYSYYFDRTTALEKWDVLPVEEKSPMSEDMEYWMNKILTLCRENGAELILYTAPFVANQDAQRVYNGLYDYAAQHGVEYCNTMHYLDDIAIEFSNDFLDEGHLNFRGQEKLTRYLAENFLPEA